MKIVKNGSEDMIFPTSFEDFTLSQFYQIQKLNTEQSTMNQGVYALKLLGVLVNKDYNYMINLPDESFTEMNHLNKELDYSPVYTPKDVIVINNVNYVPKSDMNRISQGEKVTISVLNDTETDPEKIAFNILSVLVRPGKCEMNQELNKDIWHQDPLDADPFIINFRKDQFKEHLKACDALPTLNFFLSSIEELPKIIQTSSNKPTKVTKRKSKA